MEDESQLGPRRYRIYTTLGLVLAILLFLAGVGALIWGGGAILGWFMLLAGLAIGIVSIVQLRRS